MSPEEGYSIALVWGGAILLFLGLMLLALFGPNVGGDDDDN